MIKKYLLLILLMLALGAEVTARNYGVRLASDIVGLINSSMNILRLPVAAALHPVKQIVPIVPAVVPKKVIVPLPTVGVPQIYSYRPAPPAYGPRARYRW